MPFTITKEESAGVITISDRFMGTREDNAFRLAIADLREAGYTKIIVECSKATFMDSSGVGLLIGSLTSMRSAGGDLVLAGLANRVRHLFVVTRLLDGVFTEFETLADALK